MRLNPRDEFPPITLPDLGDQQVTIPDVFDGQWGVVLFFRGHW